MTRQWPAHRSTMSCRRSIVELVASRMPTSPPSSSARKSSMSESAATAHALRASMARSFWWLKNSAEWWLPRISRRYAPTLKCLVLWPNQSKYRCSLSAVKVLPRPGRPTSAMASLPRSACIACRSLAASAAAALGTCVGVVPPTPSYATRTATLPLGVRLCTPRGASAIPESYFIMGPGGVPGTPPSSDGRGGVAANGGERFATPSIEIDEGSVRLCARCDGDAARSPSAAPSSSASASLSLSVASVAYDAERSSGCGFASRSKNDATAGGTPDGEALAALTAAATDSTASQLPSCDARRRRPYSVPASIGGAPTASCGLSPTGFECHASGPNGTAAPTVATGAAAAARATSACIADRACCLCVCVACAITELCAPLAGPPPPQYDVRTACRCISASPAAALSAATTLQPTTSDTVRTPSLRPSDMGSANCATGAPDALCAATSSTRGEAPSSVTTTRCAARLPSPHTSAARYSSGPAAAGSIRLNAKPWHAGARRQAQRAEQAEEGIRGVRGVSRARRDARADGATASHARCRSHC
mmetsp:Transcript_9110/g.28220  ORF Transcript_9110/g.28220 Transcript_9110/m.28220 type:complete len:538 (-) Transcript_9110:9-1622(-)